MKLNLLPWLLVFAGSSAWAGHEVRNGGDIIFCGDSHTPLSLDYLTTERLFPRDVLPQQVRSTSESLNRIQRLIDQKLSTLSKSLQAFIADIDNTTDDSRPYVWDENLRDLYDIDDEQVRELPYLCTRLGFQVFQAVIRNEFPRGTQKRVVFQYSREAMIVLDPLQKSFVYIHEWLWDVSQNNLVNRKINRYFHSRLFATDTAQQARKRLLNFGLDVERVK